MRRRRKRVGYRRRQANAIYELQMREAILRLGHAGYTDEQLSAHLGQSIPTIKKYRKQAMERVPGRSSPTHGQEHLPYRDGMPVILDPKRMAPSRERMWLRAECLRLRKQVRDWPEIAETLKITESEARRYFTEAIREIQASETTHAELERRLMVEQLDDMLRPLLPQATHPDKPVYEATDRALKLLERKAKLLGLDQVPTLDIMAQLQDLAQEGSYDIRELEDIARDVLARRRFKVGVPRQTVDAISEVVPTPDLPQETLE